MAEDESSEQGNGDCRGSGRGEAAIADGYVPSAIAASPLNEHMPNDLATRPARRVHPLPSTDRTEDRQERTNADTSWQGSEEATACHLEARALTARTDPDTNEQSPEPGVLKRIFGIGPEDKESGQPASKLILPLSLFGMWWMGCTSMCLAYTTIVTPFTTSYWWLDDPCVPIPTWGFDVVLDSFFLLDIVINFNTAIWVGGELVDKRMPVAKEYLQGYFCFDLITSVPVCPLTL
jgi:hypothetical protein